MHLPIVLIALLLVSSGANAQFCGDQLKTLQNRATQISDLATRLAKSPLARIERVPPADGDYIERETQEALQQDNNAGVKVRKLMPRDLYFVFAYVPDDAANQFFVLTHADVASGAEAYRRAANINRGRSEDHAALFPGVPWKFVQPHKDAWHVLPA